MHGAGDGAGGPDVVVLEHGHGAEVVAVRVAATDEEAVFFDEAEAWGGFAGAGEDGVGVAGGVDEGEEACGSVCGRERGEWVREGRFGEVWRLAHLVAMPEHLASVLRATRSPSRIFRTGPLTVAQCLIGSKDSPSWMCHSTL